MAQNAAVAPADDLDGGPAEETARFGFESADYAIDLSSTNASASRKQPTPFIQHASRAGKGLARRVPHGGQPPAQQRHPGAGERPRHRDQ